MDAAAGLGVEPPRAGRAVANLLLQAGGTPREAAALVGMAVIVALRMAAIVWGLHLPTFTVKD